jgi:hypothetical protein
LLGDLKIYCGVDLLDVFDPDSGVTPRLLLAYIDALPPDSATAASMRGGPQFRGWNTNAYISAAIVDAISANTYAFITANSKRRPEKPKPFYRPQEKVKKDPKQNRFAAMARMAHRRMKERQVG